MLSPKILENRVNDWYLPKTTYNQQSFIASVPNRDGPIYGCGTPFVYRRYERAVRHSSSHEPPATPAQEDLLPDMVRLMAAGPFSDFPSLGVYQNWNAPPNSVHVYIALVGI